MVLAEASTPHWEHFKENAAPLERGRNVEKLGKALGAKSTATTQRPEDDRNIAKYERDVRPSVKFSKLFNENQTTDPDEIQDMLERCKVDKDPLVHWIKYIKYHEDTYPSDTHAQFLLKERCTQALLHHPKYTNDVRYIRVCVLYADGTSEPQDQFKFFHKHKIGSEVAIFWLAWAWVAEKRKDFPFAEKIFKKAIQKKAKPTKIVNERYKQFQRRMSRHWLNAQNPENVYDEEENDERRSRGALSGLTEEGVRQNFRSRGANVGANRPPRHVQPMSHQSNNTQNEIDPQAASGGFQIFAEEEGNEYDELNQSVAQDNNENVYRPRFVTQKDRNKENTQDAEAWNERGGLHSQNQGISIYPDATEDNGTSVLSRWAGPNTDSAAGNNAPSGVSAFEVFVDDDCANEVEATRTSKHGKRSERSLRPRLDEGRGGLGYKSSSLSSRPSSQSSSRSSKLGIDGLVSKEPKSKATKKCITSGFDKKLLAKDENGREKCFEEHRAARGKFRTVQNQSNFNLLHRVQQESGSMSLDSSCMDTDMEEGSTIEEVEMDETSRSIEMIRECSDEDASETSKNSASVESAKKVLFGMNTSQINQSASRLNNTSIASSVVDERIAVGVLDDREETLNTKFAARELSMMFSSPGALNKSTLLKSKPQAMLFSMHHDDSCASVDEKEPIGGGGGFEIFQDDDGEPEQEKVKTPGGFTIFNDDNADNIPESKGFAVYQEESDSDESSACGHGDTASLADIMDIMKDLSPKKGLKKRDEFGDDFGTDDGDGTVLTADTAAFGDLSFIPSAGDTVNLEEKLDNMKISGLKKRL